MPSTRSELPQASPYQLQHQELDSGDTEKGVPQVIVAETSSEDERETLSANRVSYGGVIVDILIAILPLYFVAFAIVGRVRHDTLASSFRNVALVQMAAFNPTIFPILFGLITVRFIKALANYKLEKGATVGSIQHLLGSRSLLSSITTPLKLGLINCLVPCIVLLWILNPIGGQLSLRVVSVASNYTIVPSQILYLDRSAQDFTPVNMPWAPFITAMGSAFNTALFSPSSSKNGTQDVFGNIQIPMIEPLIAKQTADVDGWYTTVGRNISKVEAALLDAIDQPAEVDFIPIYSSLYGLPWTRNDTSTFEQSNIQNTTLTKAERIKSDLFGSDVINTKSTFNIETSYMHLDCSLDAVIIDNKDITEEDYESAVKTSWSNGTDVVTNGQGLTIKYDKSHSMNSTRPRLIGLESWLPATDDTNHLLSGPQLSLSQAWCNMSTTYVEAEVYCSTNSNCTVARLRPSRRDNPSPVLSPFDSITWLKGHDFDPDDESYQRYLNTIAETFFDMFVSATGNASHGVSSLTPLETFFWNPTSPFRQAEEDDSALPLYKLGSELFSQRFTQLVNTYWLSGADPYTMTGGIKLEDQARGTGYTFTDNTAGQISIEKRVLSCHVLFMALLMVISIALCAAGAVTAYLNATRRGPDVLDDFVNSLRHSPYVHVDQGPTMEDGEAKARRLRGTVIRMGDVRPDDPVGYVAIGTPNERQPVHPLNHGRQYI
ncbi:hypothetical protein LTR95_003959 [Oleoguttula sp. CCFEE 5521]